MLLSLSIRRQFFHRNTLETLIVRILRYLIDPPSQIRASEGDYSARRLRCSQHMRRTDHRRLYRAERLKGGGGGSVITIDLLFGLGVVRSDVAGEYLTGKLSELWSARYEGGKNTLNSFSNSSSLKESMRLWGTHEIVREIKAKNLKLKESKVTTQ